MSDDSWSDEVPEWAEAIENLRERERLVITLHYYENVSDRDLGEVLNLAHSRVVKLRMLVLHGLADFMQSINVPPANDRLREDIEGVGRMLAKMPEHQQQPEVLTTVLTQEPVSTAKTQPFGEEAHKAWVIARGLGVAALVAVIGSWFVEGLAGTGVANSAILPLFIVGLWVSTKLFDE